MGSNFFYFYLWSKGIAEILMNRPHARNSLGKVLVEEVSGYLVQTFHYLVTIDVYHVPSLICRIWSGTLMCNKGLNMYIVNTG